MQVRSQPSVIGMAGRSLLQSTVRGGVLCQVTFAVCPGVTTPSTFSRARYLLKNTFSFLLQ